MFQSEYPDGCKNCFYSMIIPVRRECLCRKYGIVPQNHVCKKYRFDPFKIRVRRIRTFPTGRFTAADFSIEE
jgi:hypothetical protein